SPAGGIGRLTDYSSYKTQAKKAHSTRNAKVTDYYTATMQIEDAAKWFAAFKREDWGDKDTKGNFKYADDITRMAKWAQAAQNASVDYTKTPKFQSAFNEAKRLIAQAGSAGVVSTVGRLAFPVAGKYTRGGGPSDHGA